MARPTEALASLPAYIKSPAPVPNACVGRLERLQAMSARVQTPNRRGGLGRACIKGVVMDGLQATENSRLESGELACIKACVFVRTLETPIPRQSVSYGRLILSEYAAIRPESVGSVTGACNFPERDFWPVNPGDCRVGTESSEIRIVEDFSRRLERVLTVWALSTSANTNQNCSPSESSRRALSRYIVQRCACSTPRR